MSGKTIAAACLGTALQALARQEAKTLMDALDNTRARHRGVHEARKSIRRLRSLLLLGRAGFRDAGERIDADLKALATSLSTLRDAHVVVDTASVLVRSHHDGKSHNRWLALRRQLSARRQRILEAALAADPGFAQRRERVARNAGAIDRLPWQALDRDAVQRELARSLERMRKAEQHATRQDADREQRHRWRRRLRRLRMQWNALKNLRKRASDTGVCADTHALLAWLHAEAPRFSHLATSADALGAEQDRALLRAAIEDLPHAQTRDLALWDIDALQADPS